MLSQRVRKVIALLASNECVNSKRIHIHWISRIKRNEFGSVPSMSFPTSWILFVFLACLPVTFPFCCSLASACQWPISTLLWALGNMNADTLRGAISKGTIAFSSLCAKRARFSIRASSSLASFERPKVELEIAIEAPNSAYVVSHST